MTNKDDNDNDAKVVTRPMTMADHRDNENDHVEQLVENFNNHSSNSGIVSPDDDDDDDDDISFNDGESTGGGSIFDSLSTGLTMKLNWGKMANREDFWTNSEEFSSDMDVSYRFQDEIMNSPKTVSTWAKRFLQTTISSPTIVLITLLTFSAILAAGLATLHVLDEAYASDRRDQALITARELGLFISSELDQALVPLFAMSQFVKHLEDFKQLPYQIGPRGQPGSAPPLVGKEISHRNVTGICDDPHNSAVFHDLAANVKKDAKMEGILVNVQLAPQSVVCLVHPLVNTEDFSQDGAVLNNTGAVGHDLLNDPNRVAIARATVPADDVVIAGPLTLIQGGTPVVKESFIARLAINMPGYNITVDGVDYPCWGFAVIILNWAALKEKSGLDERFERAGMDYRLTRTDTKTNATTGETYEKVVSIAESQNSSCLDEHNTVSTDLDTTNNVWKMTVGYRQGFSAPWLTGLTTAVVLMSFLIAVLLISVLVANKERQILLHKMMPPKVVKKLRRGETVVQKCDVATVFFSDVVGFTKLSSQLSPFDVMEMLNELYSAFDSLVEKHNLYKVETVGDAYMAVAGIPDTSMSGRIGAEKMALFALDAVEACKTIRAKNKALVQIRAGLASGPVVAGVIGNVMPKFSLFGDTVNVSARMESTSTTMRIQCNEVTCNLLKDSSTRTFDLEKRVDSNGVEGVFAKGKGHVPTWFINGSFPRLKDIPKEGDVTPSPEGALGKEEKLESVEQAQEGPRTASDYAV